MPTSNTLAVYIYFLALGGSGRIVRTLVEMFFDLAIFDDFVCFDCRETSA